MNSFYKEAIYTRRSLYTPYNPIYIYLSESI